MGKKTITIKLGGFGTLLTLLFITLKLIGEITWSWLWVLSPLWIPFVLGFSIMGFCFIFVIVFIIMAIIAKIFFK